MHLSFHSWFSNFSDFWRHFLSFALRCFSRQRHLWPAAHPVHIRERAAEDERVSVSGLCAVFEHTWAAAIFKDHKPFPNRPVRAGYVTWKNVMRVVCVMIVFQGSGVKEQPKSLPVAAQSLVFFLWHHCRSGAERLARVSKAVGGILQSKCEDETTFTSLHYY